MNRLAVVAFLLTFTTVPSPVYAQGRSHVTILGELVLTPEGNGVAPYGRSGALQVAMGRDVSPRLGIDIEFVRTSENEADWSAGRAVAFVSVRNGYRDVLLIPQFRFRIWRRPKGTLEAVAGMGWLREHLQSERRSSGFMPPGPLRQSVEFTNRYRNEVVYSGGIDVIGWMTPVLGLAASGRIRVATRDDEQGSRPSPLALSSGLGLRVRF